MSRDSLSAAVLARHEAVSVHVYPPLTTWLIRPAWLVLRWLAPVCVLFAIHGRLRPAELRVSSATVTEPDGTVRPITFPYASDQPTESAVYRYDVTLNLRSVAKVRIIPDDCVRSVFVDGAPVKLRGIPGSDLCDFRVGFELAVPVASRLGPGPTHLTLEVENASGPHGLTLAPVFDEEPLGVRSLALLVLLVPACAFALSGIGGAGWRRWAAAVLIAVAGWIRYHYLFDWHPPELYAYSDMWGYLERGQQIAAGQVDEHQMFQPIGYALVLSLALRGLGGLAAVSALHVLLGWASVLLVWRASARWLHGGADLVVLAIAALHVPFVTLSGFFLAETVFTFQLALLFYTLTRSTFPWRPGRAFLLGAVYMSGLWFKGNNTFFGPLLLGWMLIWALSRRRGERRAAMRRILPAAAAFCAAAALVLLAHLAFTYARYGHAVASAPTSALNLVEGKCPSKVNSDPEGASWQSPLFVQLGENLTARWPRPFSDAAYFWKVGLGCIQRRPVVLFSSLRYVYYLFFDNQLWPPNGTRDAALVRYYGMFYSALLFPGVLVGLLVAFRHPRRRIAVVGLMAGAIVLCSWVFKSELRYRVPFDVVFVPLAVLGWAWLLRRLWVPTGAPRRTPA